MVGASATASSSTGSVLHGNLQALKQKRAFGARKISAGPSQTGSRAGQGPCASSWFCFHQSQLEQLICGDLAFAGLRVVHALLPADPASGGVASPPAVAPQRPCFCQRSTGNCQLLTACGPVLLHDFQIYLRMGHKQRKICAIICCVRLSVVAAPASSTPVKHGARPDGVHLRRERGMYASSSSVISPTALSGRCWATGA